MEVLCRCSIYLILISMNTITQLVIHMAYISISKPNALDGNRLSAFVADLRSYLAKRRVYRDTLRELQSLSARELNDLGLNRTMLRGIAWEAANGL